jgi:hypothetical protein
VGLDFLVLSFDFVPVRVQVCKVHFVRGIQFDKTKKDRRGYEAVVILVF